MVNELRIANALSKTSFGRCKGNDGPGELRHSEAAFSEVHEFHRTCMASKAYPVCSHNSLACDALHAQLNAWPENHTWPTDSAGATWEEFCVVAVDALKGFLMQIH